MAPRRYKIAELPPPPSGPIFVFGSNIAGIGAVGAPQMAAVVTTTSSATALPVTGTEANAATHYFEVKAMLTAGAMHCESHGSRSVRVW